MRPDEHKKRKHSQYKKVHGIGKNAEKGTEKPTKEKKKTKTPEDEKKDPKQITNVRTQKRGQVFILFIIIVF